MKILIQRFEDTIHHRNFRGPRNAGDRAMIFSDSTDNKRLQHLLRKLRVHNPVPTRAGYRNSPLDRIIEDPTIRDSEESYLIQAVDLCAFLLYQELAPGAYMKKKAGHNYFSRLAPILCTVASARIPAESCGCKEPGEKDKGRPEPPPGGSYYPDWPGFRSASKLHTGHGFVKT